MTQPAITPTLPRSRYMRIGTPTPVEFMRLTPPPVNTTTPAPEPRQFSRLRAAGGAVVGASVPVSVFIVSHLVPFDWDFRPVVCWLAVLGGLVFSAGTVYRYCRTLFKGDSNKAIAYCVLSEALMTFAPDWLLPLSITLLAILVTINAVETGRVAGSASAK